MITKILTLEHEYSVHNRHAVLDAAGGVPVADALDAAADRLEAVVAGLRDMLSTPECSNQAALISLPPKRHLRLFTHPSRALIAFQERKVSRDRGAKHWPKCDFPSRSEQFRFDG